MHYQAPHYEPSQSEITAECQKIRAGWGPRDYGRGRTNIAKAPRLPVSTRFVVDAIRVLRSEMAHV